MVSCTFGMVVDSGSNDTRCRVSNLGTDASRGTADCWKLADYGIIATLGTGIGCGLISDCGSFTDHGPSVTLGTALGWCGIGAAV